MPRYNSFLHGKIADMQWCLITTLPRFLKKGKITYDHDLTSEEKRGQLCCKFAINNTDIKLLSMKMSSGPLVCRQDLAA